MAKPRDIPLALKPTQHVLRKDGSTGFDHTQVAAVAMEAMAVGIGTIAAVAEVFDVSWRTARYWCDICTTEGRFGRGKHQPARAMIHRNTPRQTEWLVCEQCHFPWPCPRVTPHLDTNRMDPDVHEHGPDDPALNSTDSTDQPDQPDQPGSRADDEAADQPRRGRRAAGRRRRSDAGADEQAS